MRLRQVPRMPTLLPHGLSERPFAACTRRDRGLQFETPARQTWIFSSTLTSETCSAAPYG
jgi:hypothetical protein